MHHELVLIEKEEKVTTLTLNNPPLNALSKEIIEELDQFIHDVLAEKDCRCLVITGHGEKAFASGADIRELETFDENTGTATVNRAKDVFGKLRSCAFPTIAAINSHALGGGLELALHCDFRVAAENARLGLPEINLGVLPGAGGTQLLPQLIGLSRARWMIMNGEVIEANAAYQIGLVDRVVKVDELLGETSKIAESLAKKPPLSCKAVKEALRARDELSFSDAMREESRLFGTLCATYDKKEGVQAFLERRKVEFKGL
ncbi:putative 3-hydroxybutyryl-CoA dehydratase [delta proteobacterium NaphS2]|nr:putative 3-hydroxybutyryl-CoA dehydratase [delta proteobacterium NaphS2]